MEVNLNYGFDQDSIIRLQKDLNHCLTNLDSQNVRKLVTEHCDIRSKGGVTVIDGPLVDMYDFDALTSQASTTLRLRMGYEVATSNFVFKLFNAGGVETLSLDSSGNAIFSGDINTDNDVFIGNNIFLGLSGANVTKGLYFNTTMSSTDFGSMAAYNNQTALTLDRESTHLLALTCTDRIYISAINSVKMCANFSSNLMLGSALLECSTVGLLGAGYPLVQFNAYSYTSDMTRFGSITLSSNRVDINSGDGQDIFIYSHGVGSTALLGWYSTASSFIDNYIACNEYGVKINSTQRIQIGMSSGNTYLGGIASTNLVVTKGWSKMSGIQISKTANQAGSTGVIVTFSTLDLQIGWSTDISWSSSDNGAKISSTRIKIVEAFLRLWVERAVGTYSWVHLVKNSTRIAGNIQPAPVAGQQLWTEHFIHAYIPVVKGDVINAYAYFNIGSTDNWVAGLYENSCVLSIRAIENN